MVDIFSTAPFYTEYVCLPDPDAPTPSEISHNPKLYPFFKDAIGVIDGTHIACSPTAEDQHTSQDRKGGLTQNCLAACTFDLRFVYLHTGWEGSAADSLIYHCTRAADLSIPPGKFYLADAGFPACDGLVIPYRRMRYHLQEWG